jgi:peptide/nickel transport system ATP-binding protein
MYAGRAVETGPTKSILTLPEMPYTWGLLSSVPDLSGDTAARLVPIPGTPPSLLNPPSGCPFHPRCPHKAKVPGDLCRTTLPELTPATQANHLKRCHLVNPDEIYLKEVLPDVAPDLVDPETGEVVAELLEQIEELHAETPPVVPTRPEGAHRSEAEPFRADPGQP